MNRRTEQMRRAFDETFARAAEPAHDQTDMLLVSVGGQDRAIRLHQISKVARNPGIVRVPARAEGFLGVAGIRGAVLPVFSLSTLTGVGEGEPHWLLIVGGNATQDAMAFACEAVRGYVRVNGKDEVGRDIVQVGTANYALIDLEKLQGRLKLAARSKNEHGQ